MNLLKEHWIPVRRASGERLWIAPHQITDCVEHDPIVALDAVRPDFNGALIQFLIGLVQTAWARAGKSFERETMLWEPPSPSSLEERFAPLKEAFELDGDGPRFMQDRALCANDTPSENDIGALLIEAPGEQSLERNTDHFIKREGVTAICAHCASAALFTLQTNAPSGGAGHRTSLRGGGPLTTLVVDTQTGAEPTSALWRSVANNILPQYLLEALCDSSRKSNEFWFPWLSPIDQLQKDGGETQPLDVHPCHLFWAMPRRIRLDFDDMRQGSCDVCDRRFPRLVQRYITKNYGMNYKGPWRHPLSPYYGKSRGELLPMHPQAGGLGYRHWLGWVLGVEEKGKLVEAAAVVRHFLDAEMNPARFRLWVFGYDMDNMKARCWYEATFPLFDLPARPNSDNAEALHQIVQWLLSGAERASTYLRVAIRNVWAGDGELSGDLGFVDGSFWSRTERAFFDHVEQAVRLARTDAATALNASQNLRERWLQNLETAVRRLFDEFAASGDVESCHPERLGEAYRALMGQLRGEKIHEALGLLKLDRLAGARRTGRSKGGSSRRKRGAPEGEVAP